MSMLEQAFDVALQEHKGKKDKAGVAYILHPMHLMEQMDTEEEKCVALLHDTVEDGSMTAQLLRIQLMSERVIQCVLALSREKDGETYFQYIERVKNHPDPIVQKVKKADLLHNMDITRIPKPTKQDLSRVVKYTKAYRIIQEGTRTIEFFQDISMRISELHDKLNKSDTYDDPDISGELDELEKQLIQLARNAGEKWRSAIR